MHIKVKKKWTGRTHDNNCLCELERRYVEWSASFFGLSLPLHGKSQFRITLEKLPRLESVTHKVLLTFLTATIAIMIHVTNIQGLELLHIKSRIIRNCLISPLNT